LSPIAGGEGLRGSFAHARRGEIRVAVDSAADADEVTSLAEESQQEAGKIGTMVDEITADSEERRESVAGLHETVDRLADD
jgi:hypothetical protein